MKVQVTVKVIRSKSCYEQKDLITWNAQVKYESPTSKVWNVMGKIKVFRNVGQRHSQGHTFIDLQVGAILKGVITWVYMPNMKYLYLIVKNYGKG